MLASEIEATGPVTFSRYMEQALYHPRYGYYASGAERTGRKGDFYTSVSVGPVFGRLLAVWVADVFGRCGRPAEFAVVEQGAAQGHLAHDILHALARDFPEVFAACRYVVVEPLSLLATAQQETLAEFSDKTTWVSGLSELGKIVGCFLSNELLDAFPVHLVRRTSTGWLERYVGFRAGAFVYEDRPGTALDLTPLPAALPAGYLTELRPAAPAWMREVAAHLEHGAVLTIDYGFPRVELYAPHRITGTLRAFQRHRRFDDPLVVPPGTCDITAHVDFTALAEAAAAGGLAADPLTDQHHFLVALFRRLLAQTGDEACLSAAERRQFATLMHPESMGTQFKCIAFTRDLAPSPLFSF